MVAPEDCCDALAEPLMGFEGLYDGFERGRLLGIRLGCDIYLDM
jgi:hypothetical protein